MKRFRTSNSPGNDAPDNPLTRLLATASPVADATLEAANLTDAFNDLGTRILAGGLHPDRRRTWRPTRRAVVVGLVFAVVFVTGSIGLAGMITTHTGFFPKKAGTENDTSEFLRTDAPDFPPLVEKLVKDIPFPPGDSALSRVPRYVRQVQPGPDGIPNDVQAAGVQGTFSLWAVCAWRGYWLNAYKNGDGAGQTLGADGLARVATSEAEKKDDSWWPLYLQVAHLEAKGDPSAPPNFTGFYQGNCPETGK
jgi:hypothetical protein